MLLSLEAGDFDEDAGRAWAAEIKRRLQMIRAGAVRSRNWDDAVSDMREALGRRTST